MVGNPPNANTSTSVLLVISESQNVAKRIESHLRNAGHPVRAAWVTDLEEAEDAITRAHPDVVLCAEGMEDAPHAEIIRMCQRIAPDLPVLLMGERLNSDETIAALSAGARDLVSAQELRFLRHLELVCVREFIGHRHLRELRDVRMQLANFEARHRQLLAGTADAVAHIQEGIIASVNPAFAELLGLDAPDDLIGNLFMDFIHPDDLPEAKNSFKLLQKGKADRLSLNIKLQRDDGESTEIQGQLTRGELNGEPDVQLLVRAEALAADNPDGALQTPRVPDRAAFSASLHELPEEPEQPTAALLLRVDDFSALEERLGFLDADQLVCTLRELIAGRLELNDQLFRFSTGELALIVVRPNADFEAYADTLRKELAAQVFKTESFEAHLTVTLAIYPLGKECPATSELVNELGRTARKLSKEGGNQVLLIGPTAEAEQAEQNEQRQIDGIKQALEENRFKLAYQSIASLEGDPRQLYDIFVRMMDENGRELLAREFLPVAERAGLMKLIDRWVVGKAIRLAAKRADSTDPATFFVRLSEDTLKDAEGFVRWMQQLLKDRPLQKDELVFELQEGLIENHIKKARDLATALKVAGAGIAIDYFGMANNSAKLLHFIPSNFVKFHHSFTSEFTQPEKQRRMTELMEIAKQRKLKTIVAQVEDANVMARLWQMGVNYIQGNSVQEPEVVMLQADVRLG